MKKAIWIAVLILVLVAASIWYFLRPKSPKYETAVAARGDLIQIVSVTGRVKPAANVDLAFEKGGRVARVYADVGESVFAGQIIVAVENGDIAAQLKTEEAKLDELKTGARPEDISVEKIKVANAQISLKDAQKNLTDTLNDAFTKSDDAVRNKVDQFMSNPKGSSPQLNFNISNAQLKSNIESGRVAAETILASWDNSAAENNLLQIKLFLDKVALAVNSLTTAVNLTQTAIDSYKSDISAARTNINTAISNLSAAEKKLRDAQSALDLENEELTLLLSGTRPEKIAAQEAAVENYQAQLAKTIIRAPISGVVTRQDAKAGEIAAANSVMVSLISESNFEIEADVPEADIAKVAAGNEASVTLDAYGNGANFKAKISKINPAETIIEGVATYKTTLQFEAKDERIKSGMTANVDVETAKATGVLSAPQRAVISKDGKKFIKILGGNGLVNEVEVKTGLTGSNGNVEILSGIKEGDKVVTFSE